MCDTFTSLDFDTFGVVAASQPMVLSGNPSNAAATSEEESAVPLDFEVRQSGQSFYCVIS
jgi:hypothetical protein